jgi:hypothetical protein
MGNLEGDNVKNRILTLCIGFILSGIGCSLYVYCNLGSDAFNVMNQGVARVLNMQVGNAFYLTQGVFLLFVFLVRRQYIGIGTLLGTFIVGAIMNAWGLLLAPLLQSASLPVRLCFLATAPIFIGAGIALERRSGLGMVPNDIVPVIIHEWTHKLEFRTVRILNDAAVVVIGAVLGGTFGIGTIIAVVLTGPCIQLATSALDGRFRKGRRMTA